jgi:hypothetical protein
MTAPDGRELTAVKVDWNWERRTPPADDDQMTVSPSAL